MKKGILFCIVLCFCLLFEGREAFSAVKDELPAERQNQEKPALQKEPKDALQEKKQRRIAYTYQFEFSENTDYVLPETKQAILSLIQKNSQLEFLKKQAIENEFALIRRVNNDIGIAKKVLEAYGYYSGTAKYHIENLEDKKHVRIRLYPNEQYRISKIAVKYTHSTVLPEYFLTYENQRESIFKKYVPYVVPEFEKKLHAGTEFAIAEDINKAVGKLPAPLRNNGYPDARVVSSAYSIDTEKKELKGTVFINQGLPAILGSVDLQGNSEVSSEYILKLCPWREGAVWDDRYLIEYRNILQKTGLFESVQIGYDKKVYREHNRKYREDKKEEKNKDIVLAPVKLPVLLNVKEGKKRSVGGTFFYSTDQGLGAEASWEHRNLFGNGEILKLSVPLKDEELYLAANFKKPAFGYREQNFIVRSRAGYEKTDAYNQKFAEFGFGIEREIHEKWWLESMINADYIIPKKWQGEEYASVSFENTLKYDNRNSRINPTKGYAASLKLMPMQGFGNVEFSAFVTEFDAAVYIPLSSSTVFAVRGAIGTMFGGDSSIPRGKRFFLGGGGSVRGFEHQEIGRHDGNGDPYGGISYFLFNSEIRQNMTKNLAIVPFLDGGMVYEEVKPDFSEKLALGAGIGFRYHTPIGPVRLDIAVPLTDAYEFGENKNLGDFQLYISIGQAF